MIRDVKVDDALQLSELLISLAQGYLVEGSTTLPHWYAAVLTPEAFSERLADPEYTQFVYTINNQLVGYIAIKSPCHLYHLFVAESFQKQGISKRLWQHAVATLGLTSCTVRSSLYAVPVYRRFGFEKVGSVSFKDAIGFQLMTWRAL